MIEILEGEVWDYDGHHITVKIPYDNTDRFIKKKFEKVRMELLDGRTISRDQQKKIHALIGEIADYSGDAPRIVKQHLKLDFITDSTKSIARKMFSLSDCGMDLASDFTRHLIDMILEWGIPTKVPLQTLCTDMEHFTYATLMAKVCAACQKKGELHHFDRLGMGADRKETPQLGMLVICLCREHHNFVHAHGDAALMDENHLVPIKMTEEIARKYKLTKKAQREKRTT